MSRFPFLDHPTPIAFAHRGGALDGPENTLRAFAAAVALGYRYMETDLHATRDGVLVALHDDRLDRVTDRAGRLSELPWSEVSRARVEGREPIPRFDELIDAWPDARFNLDLKHDAAVGPLAAALLRADAVDRVCVGSFSGRRLVRIRKALGPRLCTSGGPAEVLRLRATSWALPAGAPSVPCVQVPPLHRGIPVIDAAFVRAAHDRGIQVHAWTINDAEAMMRLLDLGVDGIMTDRPSLLKSVLVARGSWT